MKTIILAALAVGLLIAGANVADAKGHKGHHGHHGGIRGSHGHSYRTSALGFHPCATQSGLLNGHQRTTRSCR